jgi:hypothetical protein
VVCPVRLAAFKNRWPAFNKRRHPFGGVFGGGQFGLFGSNAGFFAF